MPTINVNDDMVSIVRWLVSDGDWVVEGQPICEVETSKAVTEVLSPGPGVLQICQEPGDVLTGVVIAHLGEEATSVAGQVHQNVQHEHNMNAITRDEYLPTRFSKGALALLEERNVSTTAFSGKSLVRRADILEYLGEGPSKRSETLITHHDSERLSPSRRRAVASNKYSSSSPAKPALVLDNFDNRVPVTKRKSEEIRVLSEGHLNALPSVLTQMVDITGLQEYLAALSGDAAVSISSIITYEVARILTTFREFNATYTASGIVYHNKINIGMAIDGAYGLKVAAICDANEKGITEISLEMESLLEKYIENTLPVKALISSTFNISDLSTLEIPWFIPLISKNQSAILGIGRSELYGREFLSMTLTFDHRVTEGKRAAEFLRELKLRFASYVDAGSQRIRSAEEGRNPRRSCSGCSRTTDEIPGIKFLFKITDVHGNDVLMCQQCIEGW